MDQSQSIIQVFGVRKKKGNSSEYLFLMNDDRSDVEFNITKEFVIHTHIIVLFLFLFFFA